MKLWFMVECFTCPYLEWDMMVVEAPSLIRSQGLEKLESDLQSREKPREMIHITTFEVLVSGFDIGTTRGSIHGNDYIIPELSGILSHSKASLKPFN
jgi:hypothetical protein